MSVHNEWSPILTALGPTDWLAAFHMYSYEKGFSKNRFNAHKFRTFFCFHSTKINWILHYTKVTEQIDEHRRSPQAAYFIYVPTNRRNLFVNLMTWKLSKISASRRKISYQQTGSSSFSFWPLTIGSFFFFYFFPPISGSWIAQQFFFQCQTVRKPMNQKKGKERMRERGRKRKRCKVIKGKKPNSKPLRWQRREGKGEEKRERKKD